MAARPEPLLRHLRRIVSPPAADPASDAALLGRFVSRRDEDAFAALVGRHGPMVLGVCRRVLHDAHRAEDAFQATFLILARRAATVRPADRLAAYLHSVARRVALKVLRGETRRHHREARRALAAPPAPAADPLEDLTARELVQVFDEELRRLPDVYRLPVTLCALEGLTQDEAARRLGWSAGSVRGRLERGRARLHARLARRGLTLAGTLAAVEVARGTATAGVPAALAATTVRAALAFAAGGRVADAGASAGAALLADGVLRGSAVNRLALVAALVLLGAGVATAAGALLSPKSAGPAAETSPPEAPGPADATQARLDRDGDPLPAGAVLRLGSLRLRQATGSHSVAFSPDGKTIVSAAHDRAIRFWDPATGKQVRQILAPERGVNAVAFSPDGKLLAGAGMAGAVFLWDAGTGREVRRLEGHRGPVQAVAFSPNGDRLLSGDADTVRLWDVAAGKAVRTFEVGQGGNSVMAFSADGRLVAAGGSGATAFVCEAATGKQLWQLRSAGTYLFGLAFAPDGTALLTAVENGPLTVWDLAAGKPGRPLPVRLQGAHTLAFSPDGKLLATGGGDLQLRLWDWAARKQLWSVAGHPDGVHFLSFAPDGKTLASSSSESAFHFWDVATGKPLHETTGHQERLTAVAYSPDGRTIITGAWERTLRVWDAATGVERTRLVVGTDAEEGRLPFRVGAVGQLALSPDGKLLAVARADQSVLVYELSSGKERYRLQGSCVAFSPDGRRIACGGYSTRGSAFNLGVIYLHDAATGKLVRELHGHKTQVASVAFTPDGQTLISRGMVLLGLRVEGEPGLSETEYLRFWDVATGRQRRGFPGAARVTRPALSPDGRTLATFADEGKIVQLIEAATGGTRAELRGHTAMLFDVAFAPDGRTLASGGMDGVVRLWDLPSGKEVGRLEGHRGWVLALAFSPDGRRLVSGGIDTTALVWDVARQTRQEPGTARLSAEALRSAWDDLAGEAAPAYRAVSALASAPEQAVPYLAERLRPVTAPDEEPVARLIAALDGERFDQREQASAELDRLGPLAEAAARKALAGSPSAETKRRLEAFLDRLDGAVPSAEEVRVLRAVEALEDAGTPEARRLLTALAGGAEEARLTRAAKASLERLARRPAAAP
jgi:RNA polymerase sigma factor (sigma-70 family)